MTLKSISSLLKKLPHVPGVYKMKDKEGRIIYVGKAKDLSKRVRSYFQDMKKHAVRTQKMVENIADLEWIEVGSDLEAIFLETNLIKELRPKYNVLMKDDKNFVYIKITKNEDYPRIEIVRKVEKDGARYFGPKTAAHTVKKTLMLLQKLFMYRSCDLGIEWNNGETKITRKTIAYPCLDFHIRRCAAPCLGKISPEEYQKSISNIEHFFEGKTSEIENSLKVQMENCVQKKEFEKAGLVRDKLLALKGLFHEQIVTSPDHENSDVFGFVLDGGKAYFNLFMLRDGKLINQENFVVDAGGFEPGEESQAGEVVGSFLTQYYEKATEIPPQILLPLEIEEVDFLEDWLKNQSGHKVVLLYPQRGKKSKLLDLAEKNARSFQKQHKARWEYHSEQNTEEVLKELAKYLNLPKIPKRMECFDISHLGGSDTVASMVVFENGIAKKSDYRKFHLRTIADGEVDDFKSMSEILHRRLRYLSHGPKGIELRKAAKTHKTGIQKLLKAWKDDEEIHGNLDEYFVALKTERKIKKVVGIIRFLPGQTKTFLLNALYIAPKFRETGIARSLFNYGVEKLKPKRVYLACPEAMKSFYENFGFESIKEMPKNFESEIENPNFYAYDPVKHYDASFKSKPDLIVIDGGKGQLSAALKSRNDLDVNVTMIGLAKREEDVFVEGKSLPLIIPKDSQSIYLLRRLRDEAHRFAISFQRKVRDKNMME